MPDQLPMKPPAGEPASIAEGKGPKKGKVAPPVRRTHGKRRMKPPVSKAARKPGPARPEADQTGLTRAARHPEGYVRFRVHVDNGEASIADSHLVRSTLVQQSSLQGNFVYEVTLGDRVLHADSIPDLGVFRSFVNPEGPPEQRSHHIYELTVYDFDVRVPAEHLSRGALPRIAIALHRVKDTRRPLAMGAAPPSVQYSQELREVARVEGIPVRLLPEELRRSARRQ